MISVSDPNPVLVEITLFVSENNPKVYYDAQHTFLPFVYFASLPSAERDWLKCHMTSLKRLSCFVGHDICNSSVPCMDDGCHGFRAGKQLAASCLH